MKIQKVLALSVVGLVAVLVLSWLSSAFLGGSSLFGTQQSSLANLTLEDSAACLTPDSTTNPVWDCYEISVEAPVHQSVTVEHESGESYNVLTFEDNNQTKFRFTPTQQGVWTFSTGGNLNVNAARPDYAQGFVAAQGNKWIRSATREAFIPQFVMYNKYDITAGLDEFIDGHGFTGFHLRTLRDFLDNPEYFETVVLETYRRGGVTHLWIWGDEQRNLTPTTYGVDVDELYTEIAARLGPIPGWTVGYGFDLFEWASAQEIEDFRATLLEKCSYPHLIGGRGHKNEYKEISTQLDYTSWEWHHPSYDDYIEHMERGNGKPVFSEDRFRIQTPDTPQHYTAEETLQGLWESAMAGGIANIWGNRPENQEFSEPYSNKEAIKTYSQFIDVNFTVGMEPDNTLIDNGYCLRDRDQQAICYINQPETVQFSLEKLSNPGQTITAIDTQQPYAEIEIPISNATPSWQPPIQSNWAFHIGNPA